MKFPLRSWLPILLLTACLVFPGAVMAHAQSDAAAQVNAPSGADAKRPDSEDMSEFRHAPKVRAMARIFHISTESAAEISEDMNSAILVLAILFFLVRIVPKAIRDRTATLQKRLIEARTATEDANERLTAVEAKLAKIGEDIEAVRRQTERDIQEDEKRVKQSLEDERQKIVKSAEQEIESAGAAAKRDLKWFAAELAIGQATKRIQLTAESDKVLVERFGKDLAEQFGSGGRN